MLPPQRGQILQQRIVQRLAVGTQSTGGTLQIDRVPQHDGRRHQIEAAGPVALLLKTAVADFTQSVEEDRPGASNRPRRSATASAGGGLGAGAPARSAASGPSPHRRQRQEDRRAGLKT